MVELLPASGEAGPAFTRARRESLSQRSLVSVIGELSGFLSGDDVLGAPAADHHATQPRVHARADAASPPLRHVEDWRVSAFAR